MTEASPSIDTSHITQPLVVELGQSLTITVRVTGIPTPTIKWQIGRKRVKESSKFELKNPKRDIYSLTIKKASSDLNEAIWVMAANDIGEDCCQIDVKVNARTLSMSDVRQKNFPEAIPEIKTTKSFQEGPKKKLKKTISASSVQNTNGNSAKEIDSDLTKDTKKALPYLEGDDDDDDDDEPYKRRSKRNSKVIPQPSKEVSNNADKINVKIGQDKTKASTIEMNYVNKLASKSQRSKSPKTPNEVDKKEILETDFDSVDVENTEQSKSGTVEIIKVDKPKENDNSDVKIVIVNNDDDDEDDDDDDEDDDEICNNREIQRPNKNNDNKVETEINDIDETLWLLNGISIIEFCKGVLSGFDLKCLEDDNIGQDGSPEALKNQTKQKWTTIPDAAEERPFNEDETILNKIKLDKINNDENLKYNKQNEIKTNSPNKFELNKDYKVENNLKSREKIPVATPHLVAKQTELEINNRSKGNSNHSKPNLRDKLPSDRNPDLSISKLPSDKNPDISISKLPSDINPDLSISKPQNKHFNKEVDITPPSTESFDTFSKFRSPSRSSLKLSQIDNVPIPEKRPTHSILGKPPPPPGTIENKPLILTAYVMHKKTSDANNRHSQNTPRRQKRLDQSRCRSADPLGQDDEKNREENEFENNKDASSESINWERYSCTLPGKWSSSGILNKSGLVPTRSEEYLIIRKSDGKVKSLNNSRDNLFRSFQSLDKWNDSEMGSTSSKIGLRTLNTQYQIVTVTTTEETYAIPKAEDKTDGTKQNSDKVGKNASEADQKIFQKPKPSVKEKGVGSTNVNLKDTGVGPDKILPIRSDKISQNEIGVGTDTDNTLNDSRRAKALSTVKGQQTDYVLVQNPTKQFDGSTQTGTSDLNKKVMPASIKEDTPIVTFTPVTPENDKVKEADMFVSQVNSFEFCEVNTFYVDTDKTSNVSSSKHTQKTHTKDPLKGLPLKNERQFSGNKLNDKTQDSKPNNQTPKLTNVTKNPQTEGPVSSNQIPPISPYHYDVHGSVTPSSKFEAFTFTPDNHTFARQYPESIPGQRYAINYDDGTMLRDLNDTTSKHVGRQERPSRIPQSVNSLKSKSTPDKKRDRSCERVVEINTRRRPSLTQNDPQIIRKEHYKSVASELDGSFSDESFGSDILSPKMEGRRSRITMSYHGPTSPQFHKKNY